MAKVKSDKDIEELIRKSQDFFITDFRSPKDKDFKESYREDDEIKYRLILDNKRRDFRYGLVDSEGIVTLDLRLQPSWHGQIVTYDFNEIKEFTEGYNKLIKILDESDAHYQRDARFEEVIVSSAMHFINS